jgi:hypothetical protein
VVYHEIDRDRVDHGVGRSHPTAYRGIASTRDKANRHDKPVDTGTYDRLGRSPTKDTKRKSPATTIEGRNIKSTTVERHTVGIHRCNNK